MTIENDPQRQAFVHLPPGANSDEARVQRARLAKLRHDLRTPLNAILGYSEMLLEDIPDGPGEALREIVVRIHSSAAELLAVVNDLLAQDRIAGDPADLRKLVGDLYFQLNTPTDAVLGYSELAVELASEDRTNALLPDLEKIHTAAIGFVGAIGDIVRFTTEKPDQPAPISGAAEAMVEQAVDTIRRLDDRAVSWREPGSILVVDDNPVNRDLLAHRLAREGHSVETAENGERALELLAERKYDLVLLDILMPGLNGYEVLQRLQEDRSRREIPVIMISALNEIESAVRCIEMGAEDYLPKPFNPVLLRARVESSLEKKRLRDRQRELFGKFATREVVDQLLTSGFTLGGKLVEATAMFSDIRSFTTLAEALPPAETISLLNSYFAQVMEAIGSEGGIVNQMVGDGLMAIFGAPLPRPDHGACAVRAARKMRARLARFNLEQAAAGKPAIDIGIGIASGQVVAGYTGSELRATYTCVGDTVNLAARLESQTKILGHPILIDLATRQSLGAEFEVEDCGLVPIKGKTNSVRVFAVSNMIETAPIA